MASWSYLPVETIHPNSSTISRTRIIQRRLGPRHPHLQQKIPRPRSRISNNYHDPSHSSPCRPTPNKLAVQDIPKQDIYQRSENGDNKATKSAASDGEVRSQVIALVSLPPLSANEDRYHHIDPWLFAYCPEISEALLYRCLVGSICWFGSVAAD